MSSLDTYYSGFTNNPLPGPKQRHSGILDNFLELQIPVLNHPKQTNEVS